MICCICSDEEDIKMPSKRKAAPTRVTVGERFFLVRNPLKDTDGGPAGPLFGDSDDNEVDDDSNPNGSEYPGIRRHGADVTKILPTSSPNNETTSLALHTETAEVSISDVTKGRYDDVTDAKKSYADEAVMDADAIGKTSYDSDALTDNDVIDSSTESGDGAPGEGLDARQGPSGRDANELRGDAVEDQLRDVLQYGGAPSPRFSPSPDSNSSNQSVHLGKLPMISVESGQARTDEESLMRNVMEAMRSVGTVEEKQRKLSEMIAELQWMQRNLMTNKTTDKLSPVSIHFFITVYHYKLIIVLLTRLLVQSDQQPIVKALRS